MNRIVLLLVLLTAAPVYAQERSGQALFDHRCGLCHRGSGPGVFMLERRLGEAKSILEERDNLTEAYVNLVVRNGIGSMPRFSRGEITDPELGRIVSYLLESRKP